MPVGRPIPTTIRYTCSILTADPETGIIEANIKGDPRRVIVVSTPVAFRWPVVGEAWVVRQENGTWYLDSPLPTNTYAGVTPGDAVINAPTGLVRILGSGDGSTDFSISKTVMPSWTAGGDLTGSFPNPTVATVLGGKTPLAANNNLSDLANKATALTNLGVQYGIATGISLNTSTTATAPASNVVSITTLGGTNYPTRIDWCTGWVAAGNAWPTYYALEPGWVNSNGANNIFIPLVIASGSNPTPMSIGWLTIGH